MTKTKSSGGFKIGNTIDSCTKVKTKKKKIFFYSSEIKRVFGFGAFL